MGKDSVKGLSFFHYVAPLEFYQMMALVSYQIDTLGGITLYST